MAARTKTISIKFTDVDGNERTRRLDNGTILSDLLSNNETGAIGGETMEGDTTLRTGDHIEVVRKSGKAG